jgi:hypothetical protein
MGGKNGEGKRRGKENLGGGRRDGIPSGNRVSGEDQEGLREGVDDFFVVIGRSHLCVNIFHQISEKKLAKEFWSTSRDMGEVNGRNGSKRRN